MTFIKDVLRTNSPQWNGDKLDITHFEEALIAVIQGCQKLDYMKKLLFAGKNAKNDAEFSCQFIPELFSDKQFNNRQFGIDVIHSIIGMATEAGELLELLYRVMQGEEFDVTNFKEELGDSQWYQAVGINAVNSSFEEIQARIIAKLQVRYKEKFTTEECLDRDLAAERLVLEK
jgi:NTP pyrophosphatase (non-canonical NTP hydrolase)